MRVEGTLLKAEGGGFRSSKCAHVLERSWRVHDTSLKDEGGIFVPLKWAWVLKVSRGHMVHCGRMKSGA